MSKMSGEFDSQEPAMRPVVHKPELSWQPIPNDSGSVEIVKPEEIAWPPTEWQEAGSAELPAAAERQATSLTESGLPEPTFGYLDDRLRASRPNQIHPDAAKRLLRVVDLNYSNYPDVLRSFNSASGNAGYDDDGYRHNTGLDRG